MPRVSVIIPAYNCARYVDAAVESVLAQTYAGYELIVVDDGSTDETSQILQQYKDKLTYIYQENQERSAARNTGIRASTGEYVAFLDSDDIWLPTKLERQVSVLDEHPDVVLVYCKAKYIDETGNPVKFRGKWADGVDGREVTVSDQARSLLLGNSVSGGGSTPMVRRTALGQVGLFDETLSYPEDWDLWARLSHTGSFAYIPEPLTRYRVYGWHKFLAIEASERLLSQHLRVIEKAVAGWDGDKDQRDWLHAQAVAGVYMRSAVANYQLGRTQQGRLSLEKAIAADAGLRDKERLIQLAVHRARLIEEDTGSREDATAFIRAFLSHLAVGSARSRELCQEALGRHFLAAACERHRAGDIKGARADFVRGIRHWPRCIAIGGALSMLLDLVLSKRLADGLRRIRRSLGWA